MNFRTLNGLRDTQVLAKELSLYGGSIDGAWGQGTASAVLTLLRSYAEQVNLPQPATGSIPVKGGVDAKDGIVAMQTEMAKLGLYKAKVDGLWGGGTFGGILTAYGIYVSKHRTPSYGPAWSNHKALAPGFVQRVITWCTQRGLPAAAASWLMACMHFESGGTFDPKKQNNGGSKYFGLIQFGSLAAKDLSQFYNENITIERLIAMTQMEQLEYVFKYFEMWMKRGKKFTQLEDFYLSILYPVAVGKKADEVVWTRDSPVKDIALSYKQNNGFDKGNTGVITVGMICATIYNTYYSGMDTVNRTIH